MQTTLHASSYVYSLEDYRGFLLCIEPAGHKKREGGRAVATRSRPGPWEMITFHPTPKGKKKIKQGEALHSNAMIHVVSTAHNSALTVDQPGLVTPSARKKGTSFLIEYHQGYVALKMNDGRYLGTTKSGKLVCNRPKGNRGPPPMYLFRVFVRMQEFDDRRAYLPLGYKGAVNNMYVGPSPTFDEVVVELCGRFLLSLPAEELQVVHRLFFQIEQMWWFYEDHKADQNRHLPHMDHQEFGRQVFRLCDLFDPVRSQYDALYAAFKNYLLSVPVFGVFIMNPSMNKVVLVKSYNGSWLGFPRGKVNQNEAEVECAVREANEEIGVDLSGRVESDSYIQFPEGQKTVKLFLVAGVDESTTTFQTQTRKEIGNISWYDLSKAKSLLPTDQWKHLNGWIRNRKKVAKQNKKKATKNKINSSRKGGKGGKMGKGGKSTNWQQSWGMEALLTGVDGGGGQFIDEEYDDNGYARSSSSSVGSGMTKNVATKNVATKNVATNKKRSASTNMKSMQDSSSVRGNGKRQPQQQQQTQPHSILTKKKKQRKNNDGWKKDVVFQGKKFGKFQFDRAKVLACLPGDGDRN